jgi:HK97 family phage major capsid protein
MASILPFVRDGRPERASAGRRLPATVSANARPRRAKETAMDGDRNTGELLTAVRELRDGLGERFGAIEARLRRVESGNPSGYQPGDGGFGHGGATGGMELQRGDSFAAWMASRPGGGKRVEPGEFSLGRLVQAMVTGERGALTDVERQALIEGSDASGGVLVGDQLAATVIDFVRAQAVVVEAGATVIPMEGDSLTWPRVATPATPKWKDELEPMEESALTFTALTLDAKTLRTMVKMSYELFEDMATEGAAAIERELIRAFALEIDRVALAGAGGKEPTGILHTDGVQFTPATAGGSYADLSKAATLVRVANHEPTGAILSAAAAGALDLLTATDEQPLRPPPSIEALPIYVTNVAGDESYVGEWPQLVIGARPQLGVRIRQVDAGLVEDFSIELAAWQRADIGLMDPAAFAVVGTAPAAAKSSSKS